MKQLGLIISCLILLVSSCKIGKNYKGTDFEPPKKFDRIDTSYTTESDTLNTDSLEVEIPKVYWADLFNDPVLDSLIHLALANNKDALIAAENVLQARYILNIQKKNLLPRLDYTAGASRRNVFLNLGSDEFTLINGQANLSWELDIWGKIRRQNEAATSDLIATEYGYRAVMISLISDLAISYFELVKTREQLDISNKNAFSRDSMLQIIKARFDKGIVPIIDVDQATIQYTIAAGAVPQFERRKVQLENAISVLLGEYPDSIPRGKNLKELNIEQEIPMSPPKELLAKRPDLIAAENQLIAQNARVGVAQANRLPALSASALIGVNASSVNDFDFGDPIWSFGGQLLGPLFYWGQLKRQVDIEQSRRQQSLLNYENTMLRAVQEVEDVLIDIRTTQDELKIAEMRRTSALQAQTLSRERYDKGVTSYLEFLEQQRQAFDAELLLADIKARLLGNHIRLYKAMGGGWITEGEKQ